MSKVEERVARNFVRIVIIGDYQLENTPTEMTRNAIEDIRNLRPDLAVVMGDFGENALLGNPKAICQASRQLRETDTVVLPLLGNHDLQSEIGKGTLAHGTMEATARRCFGVDDTFFIREYTDFRLLGVSLDSWDMQPPPSPNECHVSNEHFNWIKSKLSERPGVPVVMLTHAPPMGCGLKNIPNMHVRATNAYMDQNTDPLRWIGLTEHPEILLWLSAHYHIGHDHPDSLVTRNGVSYALTGVHGGITRDGSRQSRVMDIADGVVSLYTLDHIQRRLRDVPELRIQMQPAVAARMKMHPRVKPRHTPGWLDTLGPLGPGGIQRLSNGHMIISTADHYLWEADPVWEVLLGTLHYQEGPITDYCICGDYVWRTFGRTLVAVNSRDPWRFSREKQGDFRREFRMSLPKPSDRLEAIGGGVKVWMGETSIDVHIPPSFSQALQSGI